jgi:hypothetical protein
MKKITLIAILALALAPMAFAAGTEDTMTKGEVELGAWDASTSDNQGLVSEYESTEGGPVIGVDLLLVGKSVTAGIKSEVRDSSHQMHDLDLTLVKRMIRWTTSYTALPHRLPHDDMENLEAVTSHARQLWHTDYDPTREYEIDYTALETRAEFQPTGFSALTVGAAWRAQERDGHRQSMTISHCEGCHVQSNTRKVDEKTDGPTLDVAWMTGSGSVRGTYQAFETRHGTRSINNPYDNAIHPESRLPVFDDRLQYEGETLPYDLAADLDKSVMQLEYAANDVGGFAIGAAGTWSETENLYNGVKTDYAGYTMHAARAFDNGLRLRWNGRFYTLDTDDFFVDTIERVGIAGPAAGRTYREIYGFDPDFVRLSTANRDTLESRIDVSKRFDFGTLRAEWKFQNIDREYYEVVVGDTATTTNALGLSWIARPMKGLRTEVRYRHGFVDNPFMSIDATCSTLESLDAASPMAPTSAQYWESHDARIAETTASPESWDDIRLKLAYSSGTSTLTGSYANWSGENDSGDLTDWEKANQNFTLTYMMLPMPGFSWYAGVAWYDMELESGACVPLFDG